MAFSVPQIRKLRTNVRPQFIKERKVDGKVLPYVEAWHVIAEANRIFGHDGWDRETLSSQCIWQKQMDGRFGAAYTARARITVRTDGMIVIREGLGAGDALAATPGQAHERALKTAETDATKRALTTFGSCFGLALYKNKVEVSLAATESVDTNQPADPKTPIDATLPNLPRIADVETTLGSAEGELSQIGNVERATAYANEPNRDAAESATKSTISAEVGTDASVEKEIESKAAIALSANNRVRVDKSELLLGEQKRIRSSEHLRFVASKACLICGRQPSDAHHLRFTQPRALGKKVSDEFAVPLCRFHHDEVHRTGAEFKWWQARGIEPVSVARNLWARSGDSDDHLSDFDKVAPD